MAVEPPWVKTSQPGWEDRALDASLPLWLRISCLAYSRVPANGHANFTRGELAGLLGKNRQRIDEAIRTAVNYGWLLADSCSECLLPPSDFIEMSIGNSRKKCETHLGGRKIKREPEETSMSGPP